MELFLNPRELLRLLWRRKWFLVLPGALVLTAAVALAFLLPPVYSSSATILIEEQEIPEDLVPSLLSDYIDRRLQVLNRRVMRADNLLNIADRFSLYAEEDGSLSSTEITTRMREAIDMEVVRTLVTDPDSGRRTEMPVAFRVSFSYGNPQTALRVTNELVSLYLSTNLETRRQVATQTTSFLANERAQIEDRISRLEEELARFQSENRELLPAEATFRRQLLANVEQQLQTVERERRSLREREGFLQTQLALTEEFELAAERSVAGSPRVQLEQLRTQLATAQARYRPGHPDVIRLQRELRSLEAVVGEDTGGDGALVEQEAALTAELATLRERYTADHPDVQRVERELAGVREALANSDGDTGGMRRNPAYVQLAAQLNSVRTDLGAIDSQREQLRAEREELQKQLARAPMVEREYTRLNRELESALADRAAIADKETTAQLSSALENEAIGERLVLAEPPSLPGGPSSPNQKLILAAGMVLAMGAGGFGVVVAELFDRSIRSTAELGRLLGDNPLGCIPTIVSRVDRRRQWAKRAAVAVGVVVVGSGSLVYVDRVVMPLEVLRFWAQNQVEEWIPGHFGGAPATVDEAGGATAAP